MKTSVVAPAVIACLMSIVLTQAGPLLATADLASRDAAEYDMDALYIRDLEEEITARAIEIEAREPKHSKGKKKHSKHSHGSCSQTVAAPTTAAGDIQPGPTPTSPVMLKRNFFDEDESVLEARKKKKSKSKKKKSKKSMPDDDGELIEARAERESRGRNKHSKDHKLPATSTASNIPRPTAAFSNSSSIDAHPMQGQGGSTSTTGSGVPRKGRKHGKRDLVDEEFELEARGKKSKKHKSKKHKSDSDSDDSSERRDLFDSFDTELD